jgi:hypothetical protein
MLDGFAPFSYSDSPRRSGGSPRSTADGNMAIGNVALYNTTIGGLQHAQPRWCECHRQQKHCRGFHASRCYAICSALSAVDLAIPPTEVRDPNRQSWRWLGVPNENGLKI